MGEQKRGEVIDREGGLHAIDRLFPRLEENARIVHEHVEPVVVRPERLAKVIDFLLHAEVRNAEVDCVRTAGMGRPGLGPEFGLGLSPTPFVPAHHHHPRPEAGELGGRGLPDARVGPGHHAHRAAHVL